MKKLICLILSLMVLLSGCRTLPEILGDDEENPLQLPDHKQEDEYLNFSQMEYVHPDMEDFRAKTDAVLAVAQVETDLDALMEYVDDFFEAYHWFYTRYSLADIHYCMDMTDTYWQAEYNYCVEQSPAVDAAREDVLYALADSPLREELESDTYFGADYFDAYEGENIYDETFLALMNRESEILNSYYQVSADAAAVEMYSEEYYERYGPQLAELLVELVKVRQEQAAYAGYDSYPAFAYDFYHGRDFTPDQAATYMQAVAETFSDAYRQLNASFGWDACYTPCDETETFAYVKKTAEAMDGDIADAFWYLEHDDLYHIAPGQNKYNSSFEVYLTSYDQGFIFMNPVGDNTDKLTFAHEFGHYVADYYCWGSSAGTDVLEVHSQAMEYLSLIYADADQDLVDYKLANCLSIYVEQSTYALFEQRMYELEGEELTAENVQALYEQVGTQFGFDSWAWDSRDFVTVPHFYGYPMYIISYVVSNDLAFQLYQMEKQGTGEGLATYEQMLSSDQQYIMAFAKEYGLADPLDPARLPELLEAFQPIL